MTWVPIHAGQDHLQQYANKNALDALAELIWNGLDAEADRVDVEIDTAELNSTGRGSEYVTRVKVKDNGHGIDPEKAEDWFSSLGDSWKKGLNGRALNNVRALHGMMGRGRFYVYSLGNRAAWDSIYRADNTFYGVKILGDSSRIDGFNVTRVGPVSGPTQTTVTVEVQQGHPLTILLRDDVDSRLTARLAMHLIGNPDLEVRLNGTQLNPGPLIESPPIDVPLSVPADEYLGYEQPLFTIVDWAPSVRVPSSIVLCNADGIALLEIEKIAAHGNVRSTGYLRWSGWGTTGADLTLATLDHTPIIAAARQALSDHLAQRIDHLTATIVTTLKAEDAYPYPDAITDPVLETERQIYDLIAVAARDPLRNSSPSQRKMTAPPPTRCIAGASREP